MRAASSRSIFMAGECISTTQLACGRIPAYKGPKFMLHHDLTNSSHQVLPGSGAHLVQFYEGEEFLYEVVATFIGQALAANEPVVVIATPEHRHGFAEA